MSAKCGCVRPYRTRRLMPIKAGATCIRIGMKKPRRWGDPWRRAAPGDGGPSRLPGPSVTRRLPTWCSSSWRVIPSKPSAPAARSEINRRAVLRRRSRLPTTATSATSSAYSSAANLWNEDQGRQHDRPDHVWSSLTGPGRPSGRRCSPYLLPLRYVDAIPIVQCQITAACPVFS
jgi:hypothetical protein